MQDIGDLATQCFFKSDFFFLCLGGGDPPSLHNFMQKKAVILCLGQFDFGLFFLKSQCSAFTETPMF